MFWIALHLPLLSLEAFLATLPLPLPAAPAAPADAGDGAPAAAAAGDRPAALIAQHRITAANEAAAARGIRPGMKRATALALAPDLLVADTRPERDAAALRAVAHAALAVTPSVTLHDASTVLLEVRASLRLFGGPAALARRLADDVARLGHRVRIAAAPTAIGAAVVAAWDPSGRGDFPAGDRSGDRGVGVVGGGVGGDAGDPVTGDHAATPAALRALLDGAPVWLLGPGREHWDALQGMGLQTIGDLRRLPRSGLARRFGDALLDDLDRALGVRPDPRRWITAPSSFRARIELAARADTSDQVLAGAAVLLARLVAWAQARQSRIAAFTLRMHHEPRRRQAIAATVLRVELAEPALDLGHLQLLLREQLARVRLDAPTLELELRCRELVAAAAPNGELFPTRAGEAEGLVRLLERLRARLGDEQVQRVLPVADHRPEHASRSVPAQGAGVPAAAPAAGSRAPAPPSGAALTHHRPAWLLVEPMPLAERGSLPLLDGRPLQLVSGPERIESGWWDGAPAARDYFIAQAADGSLVWLYRGRLPAAAGEPGWFLQGRYA